MADKPDMYEAVEGFVTQDGISVAVGDLVRAGHPIMKNRDWAFRPFSGPRFELEQATAAPGEKRKAKTGVKVEAAAEPEPEQKTTKAAAKK